VAALLLAGFSVLAALTFHNNLADQMQMIMFFQEPLDRGGFLLLAANGAGPLSLDDAQLSKAHARSCICGERARKPR